MEFVIHNFQVLIMNGIESEIKLNPLISFHTSKESENFGMCIYLRRIQVLFQLERNFGIVGEVACVFVSIWKLTCDSNQVINQRRRLFLYQLVNSLSPDRTQLSMSVCVCEV